MDQFLNLVAGRRAHRNCITELREIMTTVLSGKKLARAIRRLIDEEKDVRCAVAFWGPAVARRVAERGAKVVLDISMGGTSRNALDALRVPKNRNVRVLDRLHAKLFLSAETAIICSANASQNALGSDDRAPLLEEAGVLIRRFGDPAGHDAAAALFKRYWKAGTQATKADLVRAVRAPHSLAVRDRSPDVATTFSVLAALRRDPDRFSKTAFIFGDEQLSDDEEAKAQEAYKANLGDEERSDRRSLICVTGDRLEKLVLEEATYVIMYWFGSGPGLQAYHDITQVRVAKGRVAFFGRQQWSTVRSRLGFSSGVTRAGYWNADAQQAQAIADSHGDEPTERFVIMRPDELHEHLDQSAE